MRKSITKVVALTLCLAMIACWIPHLAVPASAAAEYPNTHNNTGNMAADIVAVAVSQAGYCEGSLSGNPAYAGSNNYQKYGQWYDAHVDNIGVTYAAWCAAFVSWCANQAGVPSDIVYYHAYCPYGVNWFRNQGRFQYAASRGGSYVPNPGDIVYFAPPGSSVASHVGIVRGVSDGYVHTVEGNTSGQKGEVNEGGGVFLKSYSLSYSRLYGYGVPAYQDNSGKNPIGQIDSVTAEGPGKIRVRGWTMDEDALLTPLTTHIYIGGGPGEANVDGYVITADQYRGDIAAAFPNAGGYHGFDVVLNTGKSGRQVVNVFGINEGGGSNTALTNSGWIVDIPADTEKPVISDVQVTNVTSLGYTVTCTVSDNVGIRSVIMPTWTVVGEQDDILWAEATVSGDKATFNVSFSSHNFEYGTYSTHIYATDLAGNYEMYPVTVEVPPVLAETPVSGTVGENTYFIASSLNKNYVLDVSGISLDNRANIHLWNTLGSSKNQMWKISDADGDGYYTIISVNSGKSLDADSAGTTDGTNVQQYEFNGTDAQLWKLEENTDGTYRIINKNSGLSLDLHGGILANGQNIHLYTANDSGAQKWYLIPADTTGPVISDVQFSEISSEGFRVTCTVEDISAIQKVEFSAWTTNNGQDDQVWHAATVSGNTATCYISTADHKLESGAYEIHIYAHDTPGNYTGIITGGVTVPNRIGNDPVDGKLDSGTYFIASSQNQNYAVDVEGISTENSANVYLWQTSGNNLNQMWQISDADGDGYYTVVALHSGKYLDVLGGIAVSGTNVQQYEANYSDAQLWQIVPNDDGTYCLYSKCGGFALDLAFGEVSNGTNIRIHDANGTVAQKWYLVPAKLSADTAHTHTYVNAVVTEPTCTEGGYTTHSCANCGEQYVDDYVSAAGHSFVEGICTVCGEADPDYVAPVTLTAKGFSLSFEDEILVNFYYTISDETNIAEHGMLMFEELPTVISVDGADAVYSKPIYDTIKAGYGVTTTGIAAKEMGDTRYYVAYAKVNDGTYIYSGAYDYSPKKYAMNMLGRESTSDKQKALCVAMLNFGAAAQVYFGYNTDTLMNAELTEEQKALVVPYDEAYFAGAVAADPNKIGSFAATSGFSGKAATVSFDGAFAINYYFTPDAAVAGDMTLYIWNAGDYAAVSQLTAANASDVVTMEQQPNGSYWGQAAGIAAKALDETYYVAGVYTDANGNRCCTGVVAYSLSKYCMNNAAPGKDMQSLAANTAMYGYYAKLYFTT